MAIRLISHSSILSLLLQDDFPQERIRDFIEVSYDVYIDKRFCAIAEIKSLKNNFK